MARLIVASTLDDQNRRMTFAQIASETEKLWKALESPDDVIDLSLIAEECFARVEIFSSYEMTEKGSFFYKSPSQVSFEIEPNMSGDGLTLSVAFVQAGHEKYQILEKVGQGFKNIKDRFSKSFTVLASTCNLNHGDFHVELSVSNDGVESFVDKFSNTLDDVSNILIRTASSY